MPANYIKKCTRQIKPPSLVISTDPGLINLNETKVLYETTGFNDDLLQKEAEIVFQKKENSFFEENELDNLLDDLGKNAEQLEYLENLELLLGLQEKGDLDDLQYPEEEKYQENPDKQQKQQEQNDISLYCLSPDNVMNRFLDSMNRIIPSRYYGSINST